MVYKCIMAPGINNLGMDIMKKLGETLKEIRRLSILSAYLCFLGTAILVVLILNYLK